MFKDPNNERDEIFDKSMIFYVTQNYEKEIGEKYIDIFIQVNLATVTPTSINQ